MTITIRPRTPPPVVVFDHLPSDAEAAVYFPQRSVGRSLQRRVDGERELWEMPEMPIGCVVAWLVLTAAAVFAMSRHQWEDPTTPSFLIALGIPILLFILVITAFNSQQIKEVNPVITVDHARRELLVHGRPDPIAVANVVELIVWKLSRDNFRELEIDPDSFSRRQTSAVVRGAANFELVYLFDDDGHLTNLKQQGWRPRIERVDAAEQIAAALGVPLRRIENVPTARNLAPSYARAPLPRSQITRK